MAELEGLVAGHDGHVGGGEALGVQVHSAESEQRNMIDIIITFSNKTETGLL